MSPKILDKINNEDTTDQNKTNSFINLINEFAETYTESEYSIDVQKNLSQNYRKCTNGNMINVIDSNYMEFDTSLTVFNDTPK